jgi:hypothetical protein
VLHVFCFVSLNCYSALMQNSDQSDTSEGHAKKRRDALVAENDAREGKEKRRPTNKYRVAEKLT